jgi:prepilin-type N-terminal cleavage/methylation domain-containing protein
MTNDKSKLQHAFTFIELLVSMGILLVIFAISTVALSTVIPNTSQATSSDALVSDMRSQQTQAMSTNSHYGIYFEGSSYTLFKGADFSSGVDKFIVTLDPTVTLTNITFPGNQVVFDPGSGDVSGYIPGSDSLEITVSQTGRMTPFRINKHGATY